VQTGEQIVDRVARLEKSLLGCLLEFCWQGCAKELDGVIASGLSAAQFTTSDSRAIFTAMVELRIEGKIPDECSLIAKLDVRLVAWICDAVKGVVPENLKRYVHDLREAWHDRGFSNQIEELASLSNTGDQLALVDRMRETLLGRGDADYWPSIFHTWEEFESAPPLRFAIDGFLQEAGVTLIGGLAGHGKTLVMLEMAKALLEGSPLFGYEPFTVLRPAKRVLYLIPESSIGPFRSRLGLFRLQDHVQGRRLLVSTLSSREPISLSDPRMLAAAEGADIFLDTAVRFMEGSENDTKDTRPFVQTLFRLLRAGARSITGAHHAPKGFEAQSFMTLENILRGSGDIGAMLSTAWGVRQVDASRTALYLQNVKPRDFQPCAPFILEGRPHLDKTGHFLMIHKPGEAGELSDHLIRRNSAGRPPLAGKSEKMAQILEMRANGVPLRRIAETVRISKSTVERWLQDYDVSQNVPIAGQIRDKAEPDGETLN
jgi:AAA domain/Homeodomain-like domain